MDVLPNELLLECFKYLDGLDIFHSFNELNARFSILIRSIPLYIDLSWLVFFSKNIMFQTSQDASFLTKRLVFLLVFCSLGCAHLRHNFCITRNYAKMLKKETAWGE